MFLCLCGLVIFHVSSSLLITKEMKCSLCSYLTCRLQSDSCCYHFGSIFLASVCNSIQRERALSNLLSNSVLSRYLGPYQRPLKLPSGMHQTPGRKNTEFSTAPGEFPLADKHQRHAGGCASHQAVSETNPLVLLSPGSAQTWLFMWLFSTLGSNKYQCQHVFVRYGPASVDLSTTEVTEDPEMSRSLAQSFALEGCMGFTYGNSLPGRASKVLAMGSCF